MRRQIKICRWALPCRVGLCLIGLVLGLALTGCKTASTGAGEAGDASIKITGSTPGQITMLAAEVLTAEGFKVRVLDAGHLFAEREGSKWSNIAYGNWMGETPVWVRVKMAVVPISPEACRLQATSHLLRDRGATTEEELSTSGLRKKDLQELLNKVAGRIEPAGTAPH